MQSRWRVGAIVGVVLILGVLTGIALHGTAFSEAERARSLSLRLLPPSEWGFGREAHAPVPIAVSSGIAMNPAPANAATGQRRFRVTIPGTEKESGSVFERREVPVYLRVGATPKALPQGKAQTPATLNSQFLQSQMQRQTRMLQMFQARLNELQSLQRQPTDSLRPPQRRILQMDMAMARSQIAALQHAQTMTLQALAHVPQGPRYVQMKLSPTLIVSESFLQRMATEGETIRLGPVEFARAARVEVEAVN